MEQNQQSRDLQERQQGEVAPQNLGGNQAGRGAFRDGVGVGEGGGEGRLRGVDQGPGGERYHEGDDRDRFLSSQAANSRNAAGGSPRRGPQGDRRDIEDKIEYRADFTADKALERDAHTHAALSRLSLCVLVTRNGHTVVGKSAPQDSANFDAHQGRELAYEDALHQVWALEGYSRRDRQGA